MLTIKLNMMQAVALAIVVYYIGKFLRGKIKFFQTFCVPAPVIGGFLFALVHLGLKLAGICQFEMDTTLQDPFMMVFFTAIGVGANLETLKKGGRGFVLFLIISVILVFLQNAIGMAIALGLKENPLMGLICGSISMVGGHGSAGAWGPNFEQNFGYQNATVYAMAAATFGVIMGSLIGGPIGSSLIKRHNLKPVDNRKKIESYDEVLENLHDQENGYEHLPLTAEDFIKVLGLIFISIGLGAILQKFIYDHISIKGTPLSLPAYVTSMIISGVYVNTIGKKGRMAVDQRAAGICGDVGLNVFLVMALTNIDLLTLKDVAGNMLIILGAQTLLMALFSSIICFRVMGKNYDAAVLAGGMCGFGMGATYNALANMDSITEKYGPSPTAYFILPMVGAFAIDIINSLWITFFSNLSF